MNVTLFGKRDFVDVLGIFRWGDYPALSWWDLNIITSIFIRGTLNYRRSKGKVMTEPRLR